MKILALANISNIDNPSADSGLIYLRSLNRSLEGQGHELAVAMAAEVNEGFRNANFTQTFSLRHGVNRFSSRFEFDWSGLKEIISNYQPDIFLNNQAELGVACKALLKYEFGRSAPALVTYCHYPALT